MIDLTIDAGHGGSDPGAVGPTGLKEKDITLKLALKVGNLVTARGVKVNYTRTNDSSVGLSQRAVIANNSKARFFLSIHINSATNPAATGTETFAFSQGGQGEKLAKAIQSNLVAAIGLPNRGVKFANFAVLRETNMPAALTEVNFICNPKEEAMLKDEAFLDRAASGIAKGVIEFLGLKWDITPPQQIPQESLYRVRKSWEDAKSQIGAFKSLDNAKVECDKNPGYSVFDDKGNKVYPIPSPTPEKPKEEEKEQGTLIMDKTVATVAQLVSYALKGNPKPLLPNCTLEELAQIFIEEAEVEGVRADVAWAQSLKETGYFKYGGIVLPEQHNYSGIGALNNNSQGDAAIFETPRIGARAQIQHLKAYASTESLKLKCVDPRFHLVKRGSAKYVEWLGFEDNPNGAGWAWPGKGYGYDIIKMMNAILQESKTSPVLSPTQRQQTALKKLVDKKFLNAGEWDNKLNETITVGEVVVMLANMF